MKQTYRELIDLGIDKKEILGCMNMISSTACIVGIANRTFKNKKSKLVNACKIIQSMPMDTYEEKVLKTKIDYVFKANKIVIKWS